MEIELKNVILPTDWNDLEIEKTLKLLEIKEDDEIKKFIKILSIILNIDENLVALIDTEKLLELRNKINFLNYEVEIKDEPIEKVELDGETYYFNFNVDKKGLAEWIDGEVSQEYKNNFFNILEILSICLRKKDEEYDYKIVKERKELFKKLDTYTAVNIYTFFLFKEENLSKIMSSFLEKINENQIGLQKDGDGLM